MVRLGHREAVEVRGPGEIGPAFQLIGVGLVAVAEVGEQVALHEPDIDKASVLFDVNIKGVSYCMKYEIEQMLKTGGGAIVNTSEARYVTGHTLPVDGGVCSQ